MAYFSAPYQIFADDISTLGSRKYLTSTQFHSALWERLLADMVLGEKPHAREEFEAVSLLFEEGYNRAFEPVTIGDRIGVLVSLEERGIGVRAYFRAVRRDGEPVAWGFQTVVCASRTTGERVRLPRAFADFLRERVDLREPVAHPPIAERAVAGAGLPDLFSADSRALGARVAAQTAAPTSGGGARRTTGAFQTAAGMRASGGLRASAAVRVTGAVRAADVSRASGALRTSGMLRPSAAVPITEPLRRSGAFTGPLPEFAELVVRDKGIAFVFPGLGSYDGRILRELYDYMPYLDEYFVQADEIARRRFGHPFLPLVHVVSSADHDERLRRCPDLAQLGEFLTGVLLSEALQEKGIKPDVLAGHGFGELTALSIGGAFDVATGLDIIAQRVLALRALPQDTGGMLALSCPPERARALLDAVGASSVTTAVVDHAKRTVVSGPLPELAQVERDAKKEGISAIRLSGVGYPLHSGAVAPAADRFAVALREFAFAAPRMQVYSPIEAVAYSPSTDFAHSLSTQLVRSFDFRAAVSALHAAGCEYFVECGGNETLTEVLRRNVPNERTVHSAFIPGQNTSARLIAVAEAVRPPAVTRAPAAKPSPSTTQYPVDDSGGWPVAIVGMGCVLPGARNADEFWRNVLEGISGIGEPSAEDPLHRDFVEVGSVGPDKTYTMRSGSAGTLEFDPRVPYTREEFFALGRSQQLLALSLAQCQDRPRAAWAPQSKRVACLLGATADGIREYDEALLIDNLRRYVMSFDDEPAELRTAFANGLARLPEFHHADPDTLAPFASSQSVVRRFFGASVETIVLDAACASSLYTVERASKLLWNSHHDVILAGGVFCPGPTNSSLFAQFRGLGSTDSYPFDERAEGLIFGEGAAVLALKRLPDAIAAGDRIYAVIRGVGISSDGKSPSANVPRASGEALAMRRAYAGCALDRSTIQFVEAHATSAPVGDATEFAALHDEFGARSPELPPIYLESVKALIGNTSWVAGTASIIKICRALEAGTIPPQYNFVSQNPGIDLSASPFVIPITASPWPENVGGLPRRAAVNAFGFGGTNGHAILEAFDRSYHELLARRIAPTPARARLAVISVGGKFAADEGNTVTELPGKAAGAPLRSGALPFPEHRRLLPDALLEMDVSQLLALSSAEVALKPVPLWMAQRERIGVCLGFVGKTARGAMAIERIYLDRMRRLLAQHAAQFDLQRHDFDRLARHLFDGMERDNPAANPYTVAGTMPNFAAARVANMFDLTGPSMVINAGSASTLEALRQAESWLTFGDADIVLAGGLETADRHHPERPAASAAAGVRGAGAEGSCLLGITTQALARKHGWSTEALLFIDDPKENAVTLRTDNPGAAKRLPLDVVLPWHADRITGISELAQAVEAARHGRIATIRWRRDEPTVPEGVLAPSLRRLEPSASEVRASER